jgi:uncharacterized protein YaeQ
MRAMALKSTVFRVNLSVADIDHAYYATHELTLARHPSETDERMMLRLVALAFEAWHLEQLCSGDGTWNFGKGLSDPDEPDVWLRDFTGACRIWTEVGQPDEKPLAKACGKADQVSVYAYHHAAKVWWGALESKLQRYGKLRVYCIPSEQSLALAAMAEKSMSLQATIQDGVLGLSNAQTHVQLEPQLLKTAMTPRA